MRVEGVDFGDLKIVKDYRGDILTLLSMICRKRTEDEEACSSIADSLIQAVYEMIIYEIGGSSGKPAIEQIKKIHNNLSNIEDEGPLQISKFQCEYRATKRQEFTDLLLSSGCKEVKWLFTEETGFYQPIVIAKK